jgi:hypothetical protein
MSEGSVAIRNPTPHPWEECEAVHPYDGAFQNVRTHPIYTTEECLRILAASGFIDPAFESKGYNGLETRRCVVTGPDGERHNAGEVLALIFKAERLERLCQDRSDAVLGMLRRAKG